MLSRRKVLIHSVLAFGFVFLAVDAQSSFAGGGSRVRLFANMKVGHTKAKAKYESINGNARRKFSFELEKGAPGAVLTVSAGSTSMGTAIVDALGRAKLELDTDLGQSVPTMGVGTIISVTANGAGWASAPLK